ncbi:MAG: pseudouridine synthase, partial [Candidatus Subteraquimicrobiales bacterium]|nr:pseudouridine synthase [Candidatus Subteraquimicrobiales bacterium]
IVAPIGRHIVFRKKMSVTTRAAREAITNFRVKERFRVFVDSGEEKYTLLEVDLETGRTHQIRVHLSFFGHPVVGDPEYGFKKSKRELGLKRQFLHAYQLKFIHPRTGKFLEFEDKLPDDLQRVLPVGSCN